MTTTFKKLFVIYLFSSITFIQAQNTGEVKKRGPEDTYSRSSLSYLLLDFPNEKHSDFLRRNISKAVIPGKFDFNNISKKIISSPYSHSNYSGNKVKLITKSLLDEEYAFEIMKYWWMVQPDGKFSMDLIKKRGLYNATDEDVQKVDASKVGRARLSDAGLKLLGNNYVLVLDFHNIYTMKEYYDKQDAIAKKNAKKNKTTFTPTERTRNGFKGKLTAYLYKLNYSDTIQGYLDESFIDENKIDLNKFKNIFSHISSPYKYILSESVNADGTQINPGKIGAPLFQRTKEQLMQRLIQKSIDKAIGNIEKKVAAFRVKTAVSNINPIRAKIGTKEGITHERRFFVWEYVQNNKNKIVAKRKGVIRAYDVRNNTRDELGHTQESKFYQIGGGKISEGMTLQERKDVGIGVGVGFGSLGVNLHADINAGQSLNLPFKQFKVYGQIVISSHDYENVNPIQFSTMEKEGNYSDMIWSAGILKEFPIVRGNMRIGGKLGYTNRILTWTQDKNTYSEERSGENITSEGLTWGANFGINAFSHSIHLIGYIEGFNYFKVKYNSGIENSESIELDEKLKDIFPDIKSINAGLMLRISF